MKDSEDLISALRKKTERIEEDSIQSATGINIS
jgi:hypothetical protein